MGGIEWPIGCFGASPIRLFMEEMEGENRLRRILGPISLTSLGVGSIIGAGIFVLTGLAAHDKAGPALILSFVVSGIACVFAALCYAEFASMVPVAGSAYTYAYATLGELFAWIIGWDLVLEYAVASATVATRLVRTTSRTSSGIFGLHVPAGHQQGALRLRPRPRACSLPPARCSTCPPSSSPSIITVILVKGIRESASLQQRHGRASRWPSSCSSSGSARFYINPANWHPFAPLRLHRDQLLRQDPLRPGPAPGASRWACWPGPRSSSSPTSGSTRSRPTPRRRKQPAARRAHRHHRLAASSAPCSTSRVAAVLTGMVPYDQDRHRRAGRRRLQAGRPALGAVHHLARRHRRDHLGAAGHSC